jgi:hypothetical protein
LLNQFTDSKRVHRGELCHVFGPVSDDGTIEFDPGMGEQFVTLAPHANANFAAWNAVALEQASQRDGPNQTERPQRSVLGNPSESQSQFSRSFNDFPSPGHAGARA